MTFPADAVPKTDAASGDRLDVFLQAVEILSPGAFRIKDEPTVELPAGQAGMSGAPASPADDPLTAALTTTVYLRAYAQIYSGPATPSTLDPGRPVGRNDAFCAALSAANPGAARWEPGWRMFAPGVNGSINVMKGDTAVLAQPGSFAFPAGGGRMPNVGDDVDLLVVRESLAMQSGWYFVSGETVGSDYDNAALSRLYFHVAADDAAWLLQTLAGTLNRNLVPFRLKCPTEARGFDRTDSLVLYVARRYLPFVLRLLAPVAGDLRSRLCPGTPLFTKELLPGLGAADDPGNGASFGQIRSRFVAEGIVDAWRAGTDDPAARRKSIAGRFAKAGLNLERPHLSCGLVDAYHWPAPVAGA